MTKLSRANLATQDSTVLLQDNTTSDILPSEHRQSNINIHDSFLSLVDDNIDKDADTSLKYLSDPSGAWDSSPTHDLKLTPKIYVDDLVSGYFSGTSSQFIKGDGSLDSNNYVQDTGLYTTGINNMAMYNSSGKIERTINLIYQPSEQLAIQSNRVSDIGYFASNSHVNGQCSIISSSNYSSAGIRSFGSSFGFGLGGYNVFYSTKKMALMSDSTISSGGTDDIEVFVGGYNQSQIVTKFRQSEVVAEFTKAIKLGDSTTTEAGAIRYNSTTNKHEGYDGTTWNAMY